MPPARPPPPALAQLEGAQGAPDPEARQKLELLKAQMAQMEGVQRAAAEDGAAVGVELQSEVAVAHHLDRWGTAPYSRRFHSQQREPLLLCMHGASNE